MTYTTTSKFTRQLVGEIVKPAGAWRVDADPTFHDRMAALNIQYPQGEWLCRKYFLVTNEVSRSRSVKR